MIAVRTKLMNKPILANNLPPNVPNIRPNQPTINDKIKGKIRIEKNKILNTH